MMRLVRLKLVPRPSGITSTQRAAGSGHGKDAPGPGHNPGAEPGSRVRNARSAGGAVLPRGDVNASCLRNLYKVLCD